MLPFLNHLALWRNTPFGWFAVNGYAGGAGSANLVPDRPPPPRCEQTWAMLIKRVYEVDPLTCPECGGRMKLISFIEPPQGAVIEQILRHCGLWQAEPRQASRGPPEESERTFVPDEDDPLPPKERKRSAAGGEVTFVDEATFWATF
jgi:hypothetical protein